MPKGEQVDLQRTLAFVSFFYFAYSAGKACLFPFLTLYFRQLGLSATQTGVIFGLKAFVALWAAPLWSSCATQHGRQRIVLMVAIFMTIASNLGLTLLPPADNDLYLAFCHPGNRSVTDNEGLSNKSAVDKDNNFGSATPLVLTSLTLSTPSSNKPTVNSIHIPTTHHVVTKPYPDTTTETRHQSSRPNKQHFKPSKKPRPNSNHGQMPNSHPQHSRPNMHKISKTPKPTSKPINFIPISDSQDAVEPTEDDWYENSEQDNEAFPENLYHNEVSKPEWTDSTRFPNLWKPQVEKKGSQVTETNNHSRTSANNGMRNTGGLKWKNIRGQEFPSKENSEAKAQQRIPASTPDLKNYGLPVGHDKSYYANRVKRSLPDEPDPISQKDQLPRSLGSAQETLSQTVSHFLESQTMVFVIALLVVVIGESIACPVDKICDSSLNETLDSVDELDKYKRHHVPSIVGFGLFAVIVTVIVDNTNCQIFLKTSHFMVHFYLFAALLGLTFLLAFFYPIPAPKKTNRKLRFCKGLKLLLSDPHNAAVTLTMVITGALTSNIHNFLFWRVQDLGGSEIAMGVAVLVAVFSHIPMLFVTNWLNRKITQSGTLVVALLCLAARLLYFTFLWTPWAVVPIEVLCAFSQQALWETVTSYSEQISPPAMDRSVKAILNSLYHGVGFAVGSVVGGLLYDQAGLQVLFGISAGVAFLWGVVIALMGRFVPKKRKLHYSSLLRREDDEEEGYLSDEDSDEVYGNDWLVKALKDDF
ncbi:major facilitator superfamily domain-containing protein 6-like protein A [Patiria miniata]|uniref:Major facilitator superfamily associated domain-containing protein n=1 Tax=Patiria miniata TaxID=46514 RepID=A0A914AVJ4_PATMI|nr:major facilitator superfamily domain-containing protein 6-like protein A [Patiria miniata]XP_038067516.1 major facilitator superfamily domain-containing protein 6-like protein A [Patiria miniata]